MTTTDRERAREIAERVARGHYRLHESWSIESESEVGGLVGAITDALLSFAPSSPVSGEGERDYSDYGVDADDAESLIAATIDNGPQAKRIVQALTALGWSIVRADMNAMSNDDNRDPSAPSRPPEPAVGGEAVPFAWIVRLRYGPDRWSGEMFTDTLPEDNRNYQMVRPLYTHPPEGDVRKTYSRWLRREAHRIGFGERRDTRTLLEQIAGIIDSGIDLTPIDHNAEPALPVDDETKRLRDEAVEIWALIDRLRTDEGNSVTIVCDNPDFGPEPNSKILVCADWTNWKDREFSDDSVLLALRAAALASPKPPVEGTKP